MIHLIFIFVSLFQVADTIDIMTAKKEAKTPLELAVIGFGVGLAACFAAPLVAGVALGAVGFTSTGYFISCNFVSLCLCVLLVYTIFPTSCNW